MNTILYEFRCSSLKEFKTIRKQLKALKYATLMKITVDRKELIMYARFFYPVNIEIPVFAVPSKKTCWIHFAK